MNRRRFLFAPLLAASARDRSASALSRGRARHGARVSARPRQPSGISHGVVVRHRLAARRGGPRLRRAGDVLPHAAGVAEGEREPLRAGAAPVRARRDRRSARGPPAPRPARGARGLRPRARRRRTPPTSRSATGRCGSRGRRATPRSVVARDFAFDARRSRRRGRSLLQGERGVSRKGPRDAQASFYYSRPQLRDVSGTLTIGGRCAGRDRHRVARSRMVERVSRARGARMGLDRPQFRRRQRADGVRHPRQGRHRLLGGRHVFATRPATCASLAPRRRALHAAAALALAAHQRRVSGRDAGRGRRQHATISRR